VLVWRLALALTLLAVLVGGWPAPTEAQDEVPAAGPPLAISQRLRAQGHTVDAAEAAYLDADEQVTDEYVRLLGYVQMVISTPASASDWRDDMVSFLEPMALLAPDRTPVPPPDSLAAVHTAAVGYRTHLGAAALQWLRAVEANDPQWVQAGLEEYGAAERARLAWQKALYERYVGEPAPGP
jgi:hypothetical protein